MLMNLDKFFIEEMKKEGYEISFKEMQKIYSNSRKNHYEELKKRKILSEKEKDLMHKYSEKYYDD